MTIKVSDNQCGRSHPIVTAGILVQVPLLLWSRYAGLNFTDKQMDEQTDRQSKVAIPRFALCAPFCFKKGQNFSTMS